MLIEFNNYIYEILICLYFISMAGFLKKMLI